MKLTSRALSPQRVRHRECRHDVPGGPACGDHDPPRRLAHRPILPIPVARVGGAALAERAARRGGATARTCPVAPPATFSSRPIAASITIRLLEP